MHEIGKIIGNQSVVVVIDVKRKFLVDMIFILQWNHQVKMEFRGSAEKLDKIGIGEIVINSIDNDGSAGL